MKRIHSLSIGALSLAVATWFATAAGAQTYMMSGKFGSSRGGTIDIPLVGATPNNCTDIKLGQRTVPGPIPQTSTPGPTRTTTAQPFGCISGGPASITTTGAGVGGQLTIPPSFFSIPQPGTTVAASVPIAAQVIQLATSFGLVGPVTPQTTPNMGYLMNGANTALPRVFRTMAWTTQTGRAAPSFTWCPGAGTACNNVASAPAGSELIIKYTGGANTYGGTMALVITSGPNKSSLAVNVVPGLPAGHVGFAVLAGMGSQPTGKGYINLSTDALASGPAYLMYMVAPVYVPQAQTSFSLITSVANFAGYLLPPATNFNYGFPFTTGTVVARNTGTALGNPVVNTLTGMGADTTSMGARNISLVAGAVAHTSLGTNNPTIASMALNLMPEPGATAQLTAAVAALLGIAAWRARRCG